MFCLHCRFIVMRRVFLIMSILYFLRAITMYVTVLPMSSETYYCSPKSVNGTTVLVVAKRAFQLMSGFGLSINGKHTYCGDFIYSGHTVMLVLGYLVISECKFNRFARVMRYLESEFELQMSSFQWVFVSLTERSHSMINENGFDKVISSKLIWFIVALFQTCHAESQHCSGCHGFSLL